MESIGNHKKISVFEDIDDPPIPDTADYVIVKFLNNERDRKLEISDKIVRPIWHGPGCLSEIHANLEIVGQIINIEDMPYSSDKIASGSAQLGTIGRIIKAEDMPYLADDIVINTQ